jgi:cardiolipin synthase
MSPQLQEPYEFLKDLKTSIKNSTKRVWIQAMVVEYGQIMASIEDDLVAAVNRGVDVRIQYDWVTQRYLHGDLELLPSFDKARNDEKRSVHKANSNFFSRAASNGIKVIEMNRPFITPRIFPVFNRNHIKLYICDDVGWVGGLNFFDGSFENLDFEVRYEDENIVDCLEKQFVKVNEFAPRFDYFCDFDENNSVFVDSGKVGGSIIYEQALKVLGQAKKEIVFASQLVPEKRILDLILKKASEGVGVTIVTSQPTDNTFTKYPLKFSYLEFRKLIKNRSDIKFIHLNRKIHAKLIIVDNSVAMFGSHNFVESGVWMGTEEIAVRTKDKSLVDQLVRYFNKIVVYKL